MLSFLTTALLALCVGASVRFGQGISDVAGSIGGTVFSRNASGAYMRNRTHPTNPQTPAQTLVRSLFGAISAAWRSLTDAQRTTWIDAATGSLGQRTNKLGEVIQLTGQQLYVGLNKVAQSFGLAELTSAPPAPSGMAAVTAVVGDLQFTNGADDPSVMTLALTLSEATSDVLVYASAPLSAGISRPMSARYKLIGSFAAVATGSAESYLAEYTVAHGVPSVEAGQVVWFRIVPAISTAGVTGAEVTFQGVFVEAAP